MAAVEISIHRGGDFRCMRWLTARLRKAGVRPETMRRSDLDRMVKAELISEEQRRRIAEHFGLKEDGSRFLTFLVILGGGMVALGVILLIGANWEHIPDTVKLGSGLSLLALAHACGWWLAQSPSLRYQRAGEALHLAGAGLFLANLALVGQIYHLSSRTPDVWWTWWVGIVALPWITRGRTLNLMAIVAFAIALGTECWAADGWFHRMAWGFRGELGLSMLSLLGLSLYGIGMLGRDSRWSAMAGDTERLGFALFGMMFLPFLLAPGGEHISRMGGATAWPVLVLAVVAAGLAAAGASRMPSLTPQWRNTWGVVLGAAALYHVYLGSGLEAGREVVPGLHGTPLSWAASMVLFGVALVLVRVGLHAGVPWKVNGGMLLIALVILATYITLVASMTRTGLVFVVSGVFLIGFAVYLERRRRELLARMHAGAAAA